MFTLSARLLLAGLLASASVAFAEDEICASCGQQVSVSGSFTHHKDDASVVIEGAGSDAAVFREEVNGSNFTVTITHLPADKYTITISAVETVAGGAGERLFDVTAGDKVLAKDFDIFATAGGARKVAAITGSVEHEDDSLKGPLTVSFTASKGAAKFNTFEVKNAAGASAVSFSASELADAFSAAATRVPEISEAPIWKDPSHPLKVRTSDLIRRMSLAEKVAQLQNGAPSISRLGLPAYNYWNEALHLSLIHISMKCSGIRIFSKWRLTPLPPRCWRAMEQTSRSMPTALSSKSTATTLAPSRSRLPATHPNPNPPILRAASNPLSTPAAPLSPWMSSPLGPMITGFSRWRS